MLGQSRRIAVVIDEHRQPQAFGHDIGERDIRQLRVHPHHHPSGVAVHERRDPEADRCHVGAPCGPDLGDRVHGHIEQGSLV